jgi:Kip1 ubiquitination-promoting complex protein 1
VAVFSGKYFFEVHLLTGGLMQIGWCTYATPFQPERGVGDDETSYAFDGYRVKKWNGSSATFGSQWAAGDVIGTSIDFGKREITFYKNEESLGVAFTRIRVGPNMAYFPAISFSAGQRVVFNFG